MKSLSRLLAASRVLAVIAVCFTLTSCGGSKIKGTYAFDGGEYVFDGSNVTAKMAGMALPAVPYTVDGKNVTIKTSAAMPGAPDEVLTINDDGSLDMKGTKLVKK